MPVAISMERPDTAEAVALIDELECYIAHMYPHDREHGLSPSKLAEEGVAFFVIRSDSMVIGCGGVKKFESGYGEIVRMYVRPRFRGRGLGKQMLRRIEEYALEHGIKELRLKTGIYQLEALSLYERHGYRQILPFGSYREHPLNRYYAKKIC